MFVSEKLRPQARTPEASTNLQIILKLCLAGLIGSFDLSNLTSPHLCSGYPYYGGGRNHSAMELLKLCFTLQLPADANRVLAQFLALPKSNEAVYIKSGLVPFLKDLPTFLATQHTSLVAAPYSLFAAEVVKKFTRHVFGPKPSQSVSPQELRAIGCGCAVCDKHLVPFLTSNSVTASIREKQKDRIHLEQRLSRTQGWGVIWTTIRHVSPHTLQVCCFLSRLIRILRSRLGHKASAHGCAWAVGRKSDGGKEPFECSWEYSTAAASAWAGLRMGGGDYWWNSQRSCVAPRYDSCERCDCEASFGCGWCRAGEETSFVVKCLIFLMDVIV